MIIDDLRGLNNLNSAQVHNQDHKMDISNPRRILAVSRPDSGLLELLKGSITYHLGSREILTQI
jgi:hypothetical protein